MRAGWRNVAAVVAWCTAVACTTAAAAPTPVDRRDAGLAKLAVRAESGVLGVAVLDPTNDVLLAALNAERPMPMQSVMKAPLGAFVLALVDRGRLRLDQRVTLARTDLSAPRSPINDAWPARDSYTVAELLEAAVGDSDNTAADVLLRLAGGPGAATDWLRSRGIEGIRIDRYEREFQPESMGLPPFRPEWASEDRYSAALEALPEPERLAATRRYLADARDTATPLAAARFMAALVRGELLSAEATAFLLDVMTRTGTGAGRLKAGLPKGATIAHKTGTGRTVAGVNQATNDLGVVTLADGGRVVIAAFLSGATSAEVEREAMLAEVARAAVRLLERGHPQARGGR